MGYGDTRHPTPQIKAFINRAICPPCGLHWGSELIFLLQGIVTLVGCYTFGKTIEEAQRNLADAISVYIQSLIADGLVDRGAQSVHSRG